MIKFGFYGRVSAEDQQDPESSRSWQLTRSRALIEPRDGMTLAEFFDVDKSRSIPWQRRPDATALLAELKDKNRGFDGRDFRREWPRPSSLWVIGVLSTPSISPMSGASVAGGPLEPPGRRRAATHWPTLSRSRSACHLASSSLPTLLTCELAGAATA
jgi:hypothetical protein